MGRKPKDENYNYLIDTARGNMWLDGWTLTREDKGDKFLWALENKPLKYRDALWALKRQASSHTPGQLLSNLEIKIETNRIRLPYNINSGPAPETEEFKRWVEAKKL